MITRSFFLFFLRSPIKLRIYIVVSVVSIYYLGLYEFLPQNVSNLVSLIFSFIIPCMVLTFVMLYLPRILNISSKTTGDNLVSYEANSISDENVSFIGIPSTNGNPNSFNADVSIDDANLSNFVDSGSITNDNARIDEIVNKKMEPVENEILQIKDNTSILKEDVSTIKTSIEAMFSQFETAMIDIKSLQSELSTPVNPMPVNQNSQESHHSVESVFSFPVVEHSNLSTAFAFENSNKPHNVTKNSDSKSNSNVDISTKNKSNTPDLTSLQMDSMHMSLSQLMNMIEFVGDTMEKMGKDSVNLLIEHCKLIGINSKTQDMILEIANMINKSNMSINSTLIMLYKFASLNGLNDRDADAHYIRLLTNQPSDHTSSLFPRNKTV